MVIRSLGLSVLGTMTGLAASAGAPANLPPCPPMQLEQLTAPSCTEFQTFGRRLAVFDGRLAEGHYEQSGGKVRTYVLSGPSQWTFESELSPPGLHPIDNFGASIEFATTDLLAVGRSQESGDVYTAGVVDLFSFDHQMGQWTYIQMLTAQPRVANSWFGHEVTWARTGERSVCVVGAPGSDGHGLIGAVHGFTADMQGVWSQAWSIEAPDQAPEDAYGFALDHIEGNGVSVLAVGAPGHAYVARQLPGTVYFYRFDALNDEWIVEAQFQAPVPYVQDFFGYDVAVGLVNDVPGVTHRVAVGRPHEGGNGAPAGPGAVYIYDRHDNGSWTLEAHITPPIANPGQIRFGWSVDLNKDGANRLIVGAPVDSAFGGGSGSAYVLERDSRSGEWVAAQGLNGQDSTANDLFGSELALGNGESEGQVIVGAEQWNCPDRGDEFTVGAAYIFDLNPGQPGNCPPPVLTLQKVPDCFSGPGGEIKVRWFQATPDQRARIALLYAKRTGNFVIPNGNPCSGTALELGQLGLQVAHTGSAGQFGAGRIKRTVPRSVCGGYLQLVDITRCATSNIVRIE